MSLGPCVLDPAFHICAAEALGTPELVENFDRLTGFNLLRKGSPVELAIDDATGRQEAGVRAFAEFVRDYVYGLLPDDVLDGLRAQAVAK